MRRASDPADFGPIADLLRREVRAHYERRGESLAGRAGAATLETNSGYAERRGRPLVESACRRLGRDSIRGVRILDLGCGFGALSVFFAAQGARVTGLDHNAERFAVGRAVAERCDLDVRFVQGRMERLDLADATFDLAVMNNSLVYVVPREERDSALAETRRVLRPGGAIVLRNPNRWNPVDQFTRLPLVHLLPPQTTVRAARLLGRKRSLARVTSPHAARRELRAAGFEGVVHDASGGRRVLRLVARYQQFSALRPHQQP